MRGEDTISRNLCQDIPAEHDFLTTALGFTSAGIHRSPDGQPVHAELRAGKMVIWLHRVAPDLAHDRRSVIAPADITRRRTGSDTALILNEVLVRESPLTFDVDDANARSATAGNRCGASLIDGVISLRSLGGGSRTAWLPASGFVTPASCESENGRSMTRAGSVSGFT